MKACIDRVYKQATNNLTFEVLLLLVKPNLQFMGPGKHAGVGRLRYAEGPVFRALEAWESTIFRSRH